MEQDFSNRAGTPRKCGKCLFQLFWNKMEQQYLEHVTLPMYPVHKAHRAKRDAGCALTFFSERPQSRFRHRKARRVTSTSSGLKRLKTQNTTSGKRKGDALKGIPKSIHKRELILDEEEFDASSFGGGAENRTPVHESPLIGISKLSRWFCLGRFARSDTLAAS